MAITKNKYKLAVFNLVLLLLSVSVVAQSEQSEKDDKTQSETFHKKALEYFDSIQKSQAKSAAKIEAANAALAARELKLQYAETNLDTTNELNKKNRVLIVFDSLGKITNGYPQYIKTNDYLYFDLRAITNRLEKANKDFIEKLDIAKKIILKEEAATQSSECCFADIQPSLSSFFNKTLTTNNGCCHYDDSNGWYDSLNQFYKNTFPLVLTFQFKYNGKTLETKEVPVSIERTKIIKGFRIGDFLSFYNVKKRAKNLEIEISLKENNRSNIVTRKFFDTLKKQKVAFYPYQQLLKQEEIVKIKKEMDEVYYKLLTDLLLSTAHDKCCFNPLEDVTARLNKINNDYCNQYKIAEKIVCKNIPWLVNTTWLTGEPKLNVLGLIDEDELTEAIDKLTLDNKVLKMQLATADTLMLKCRLLDCADEIDAIAKNKGTLLEKLLKNEETIAKSTAKIAANQKRLTGLVEESKVLNQWKYFISNPHEVFIMRNHDAANKLEMVDQWTPFKQLSYAQDEKVRVVSYNINELAKLGFGETTVQIAQEQSVFTETFLESTNGFADALRDLKNINLQTVLPDFLFDSLPPLEKNKCLREFQEAEKCFITNYSRFMWLSKQSSPVTDYKLAKRGALLYTDVQTPNKKNKIPALVQYQLSTTEGTPPKTFSTDSFAYKVYRKLFVQVAAGISLPLGVGDASRFNTVYNQNNGTFTSTALKPYDVMLAIKVFPMGLNIRRWFPSARSGRYGNMLVRRGDHVVNRLSLIFGMGLSQSQLKNYFAGVGFEIVPGLGINTGVNMYGQNYYQVENGALISQEQRFKPAPFIAFTVDPVVMIRASNLFNFKF